MTAAWGAQRLLDSVYAPPRAAHPWTFDRLLAPAALRFYGLGRLALTDLLRAAGVGREERVLFPSFICREAVLAARVLHCEPKFYPVGPDMAPASDPRSA